MIHKWIDENDTEEPYDMGHFVSPMGDACILLGNGVLQDILFKTNRFGIIYIFSIVGDNVIAPIYIK